MPTTKRPHYRQTDYNRNMSTEAEDIYRPLVSYPTQMSLHHVAAKALSGIPRSRKQRLADRLREKAAEQPVASNPD